MLAANRMQVFWRGNKIFPPAEVGSHRIARFEFFCARLDDFANGSALKHFADLERRHIRFSVIHAPAHIRIHRHEKIANQHLLILQRFQFGLRMSKVGCGWNPAGAGGQSDLTTYGGVHKMVLSRSELMPVGFLHLNIKMAGGFLKIGKRQIPFGVRDITDLVEPRHGVTHMRRIGHRLFACAGKGESRVWQQHNFVCLGKMAMRCLVKKFPSWFRHGFLFREGYGLEGCSGIFLSMYCIKRRWVALSDWVATSATRLMIWNPSS